MGYQVVPLPNDWQWPADVDVWHVMMPGAEMGIDRSVLDGTELEHAARYRHQADRVRFLCTRVALRCLLGTRLGLKPSQVRFAIANRGKPELAAAYGELSFNVSHSGEHALIAISDSRTVGVDVERMDPAMDWRELLELVCTADEKRDLMAQPAPMQREHFFRCWTAKEALLKALGLGIAEGLHAVTVNQAGNGVQHPVLIEDRLFAGAADLGYCWLTEIPGYMGCLSFSSSRKQPAIVAGASRIDAVAG
jgi:4'-phosphopantetheinyl transferase